MSENVVFCLSEYDRMKRYIKSLENKLIKQKELNNNLYAENARLNEIVTNWRNDIKKSEDEKRMLKELIRELAPENNITSTDELGDVFCVWCEWGK
jgi:uncharacterized protein (DUF342 family)